MAGRKTARLKQSGTAGGSPEDFTNRAIFAGNHEGTGRGAGGSADFRKFENTTVIKDTFSLAGIADEQAQKRFLEDGLIYNGMFRVLCDGGKDIEKEVLNHPQRREQARRIMREWGMDEERQREFLNRNRQTENNNDAEKKLLLLRGQNSSTKKATHSKNNIPAFPFGNCNIN